MLYQPLESHIKAIDISNHFKSYFSSPTISYGIVKQVIEKLRATKILFKSTTTIPACCSEIKILLIGSSVYPPPQPSVRDMSLPVPRGSTPTGGGDGTPSTPSSTDSTQPTVPSPPQARNLKLNNVQKKPSKVPRTRFPRQSIGWILDRVLTLYTGSYYGTG